MLRDRLAEVRSRIERAAERAGRNASEITLVGVTKIFPAAAIEEGYAAGLRDFGENYVQEFEGKYPSVKALEGARFHLIGHLQSNKARRAAEIFNVIETIDSGKLAQRLNDAGRPLDVMLEVKLAEEDAKSGAAPQDTPALMEAVARCPNLRLTGLMTMPPWSDDAEVTRPYFRRLRELAERCGLKHLSMGMSHDFEAAIEEGSTEVRIGTALFGSRRKA